MTRRRYQYGFTLLEIVVAVGIFALFSILAYGGLMQVLNSRERLEVERLFWQELSLAMHRIEDDLTHARSRPVREIDGNFQPAFKGQVTDTRATGAPAMEITRGGILVLDDGRRADLQRVDYRLTDGKLKRAVWPVLDRAPVTRAVESNVLSNVEEFTVRFFTDAGSWVDRWPPENNLELLPRGVELTIKIAQRGTFTRIILVNG